MSWAGAGSSGNGRSTPSTLETRAMPLKSTSGILAISFSSGPSLTPVSPVARFSALLKLGISPPETSTPPSDSIRFQAWPGTWNAVRPTVLPLSLGRTTWVRSDSSFFWTSTTSSGSLAESWSTASLILFLGILLA